MDSRSRLWWVMGGVALLLVVVLTGGLYWLRPVDSTSRDDFALPRSARGDAPFEYVAQPGPALAVRPSAETADPAGALTGLATAAAPAVGALEATPAAAFAQRQPQPRVTVNVPAPAGAAATPEVRAIPTGEVRGTTAATPAASARTPPAAETAARAATAVAPVAKRTVPMAKLAPSSPLHEFWVQVGSFASRARADALGQRLSDQGIVSRVTTRASGADLFFRVRVGPYASREEAEKFLAWVQEVDGLDGSYISEVRNAGG